MSHSRDFLQHIEQLRGIRNIMNSMKNLAFIETRKLERLMHAQRQVVANIETAAADFLGFYPYPRKMPDKLRQLYILVGSERGFCGDFNEKLLASVAEIRSQTAAWKRDASVELIGIGRKLCSRLDNPQQTALHLAGADVAEEIPAVLNRLLAEIGKQQLKPSALNVTVLYHDFEFHQVRAIPLLPPFQHADRPHPSFGHPPQLYLTPVEFLQELIELYLFAVLHEIFYSSLMAENQRRLQHMQGAIQHLDERCETLKRKYNTLRQEEITEEIEVILMTAESLDSTLLPR
ncbi:MAG: F0F1 ATP synthase subunit gamma [Gammaproteobacteria bacterium]